MTTTDVGSVPVPVRRPFREKVTAIFRFSKWIPKRSSQWSDKKRLIRTKTDSSAAQKTTRSPNKPAPNKCSTQNVKDDVQSQHITSISNPPVVTKARFANHEPPSKSYTSRRIGSTVPSRNYSGPLSTTLPARSNSVASRKGSRHNSGIQSVPVSGELPKGGNGSPTVTRSSSKSLSKLRDQYVRAMLKLGDMADRVALGNSVSFESQIFESDAIRKRSQAENETMEFYLKSSIQPEEWNDAHMGSRIMRNRIISV